MSKWKKSAVMPSTEVTARSAQHEIVGAVVAHHADALHRQEHRKGLPDRVVEPGLADLVEIDRVGLAQDVELFARDRARARGSRGPGPGNGCRPTNASGRPSSRPSARTSSLKSMRSGSTRRMFMRSGSPPTLWCDLMVTDGPPVKETDLDHVGIERALRQELGAADLLRLRLERLDEEPADRLPLLPPGRRPRRARRERRRDASTWTSGML